jgi:hypothetical protein
MTRERLNALGLRVVRTSEEDYQLQILHTVEEDGKVVTKPRAVKPTTEQVYKIYQIACEVSDELAEALTGMSKALYEQEQRHAEQMHAKNRDMDLIVEETSRREREYRAEVDEMIVQQVELARDEAFRAGWADGAQAQKAEDALALRSSANAYGMLASRALVAKAEDIDRALPVRMPEDKVYDPITITKVDPNQMQLGIDPAIEGVESVTVHEIQQTPEQMHQMLQVLTGGQPRPVTDNVQNSGG